MLGKAKPDQQELDAQRVEAERILFHNNSTEDEDEDKKKKRKRTLCDSVLKMETEKLSPDPAKITMSQRTRSELRLWSNQLYTSMTEMDQQIGIIATSVLEESRISFVLLPQQNDSKSKVF